MGKPAGAAGMHALRFVGPSALLAVAIVVASLAASAPARPGHTPESDWMALREARAACRVEGREVSQCRSIPAARMEAALAWGGGEP